MVNFEKVLNLSQGNTRQFIILVRHFFHRLFQNDFVAFEDQMKERTIGLLVILSVLCGHIANLLTMKYMFFPDTGTSWLEKCYFLSFVMVLIGFISVVVWEVVFLDLRDYSNLMPLPIGNRMFFLAKFSSLCLLVGLFSAGTNVFSALVFSFHLVKWRSDNLFYGLKFMAVHLLSVFGAGLFAFFSVVLIIGILMTLLSHHLFNKVSPYFRSLFLIAFSSLIVFFLIDSKGVYNYFSELRVLRTANSPKLLFYPPMWFTGLYERLLGNKHLAFQTLSHFALIALGISIVAFFISAGFGYRRYIRKMGSIKTGGVHLTKLRTFFSEGFNSIFLRNAIQRAIFHFFRKTLKTSMLHKMRLLSFVAVSFGLVLVLLTSQGKNPGVFYEINNQILLSIPLILSFFILLGLRGIIKVPTSLEANWIFKLTEFQDKWHYFAGLRKGIFFLILVPLFMFLFMFYLLIWNGIMAFYHCLFGLMVSVLVMETFFMKYPKIPFTCSYLPGQEKMHVSWIAYSLLFLVYIYAMSWIELKLLHAPLSFFMFYSIVLLIIVGIRIYQRHFLYNKIKIKYEEKPEPVLVGLESSD